MAERQALHFLALPRAWQQDLRRQGTIFTHTAISSRAAALLRLAATTVGRSDTALGAFYRRLSSRAGKAKAVTATARKIAVLFFNTLRHGMSYKDPGADQYEQQYRNRVLANLQRRAKSLGFLLQAIPDDAEPAVS
jgi:transposase